MANNRTIKMLTASFRGIEFRVRSERQTNGGRRLILHEYLNSNTVFIEDIGEIPPRFSVDAFVHGSDWLEKKDALIQALNAEGFGRLVLPSFGALRVQAFDYSIDQSQTSLGEVRFSLSFAVGRKLPGPTASLKTSEDVFQSGDNARLVLQNVLENNWKVPGSSNNVLTAIYDWTSISTDVLTATQNLLTSGVIGETRTAINNFIISLPNLIKLPATLAQRIGTGVPGDLGIFSLISAGLVGGAGLVAMTEFCSFGSGLLVNSIDIRNDVPNENNTIVGNFNIPLWEENTAQRIDRNDNRLSAVNFTRVNSLVIAYEQAAANEYSTAIDIQNTREALESIHDQLMRIDVQDRDIIQSDPNVREAVEDVRIASLEILDQKEQRTFVLTEVNYGAPTSAFLIAYNLYSERLNTVQDLEDRSILIRGLNPEQKVDQMFGDITTLQRRQ